MWSQPVGLHACGGRGRWHCLLGCRVVAAGPGSVGVLVDLVQRLLCEKSCRAPQLDCSPASGRAGKVEAQAPSSGGILCAGADIRGLALLIRGHHLGLSHRATGLDCLSHQHHTLPTSSLGVLNAWDMVSNLTLLSTGILSCVLSMSALGRVQKNAHAAVNLRVESCQGWKPPVEESAVWLWWGCLTCSSAGWGHLQLLGAMT